MCIKMNFCFFLTNLIINIANLVLEAVHVDFFSLPLRPKSNHDMGIMNYIHVSKATIAIYKLLVARTIAVLRTQLNVPDKHPP